MDDGGWREAQKIDGRRPPLQKREGRKFPHKALTPQLMVCYLRSRHYALSQVRVS